MFGLAPIEEIVKMFGTKWCQNRRPNVMHEIVLHALVENGNIQKGQNCGKPCWVCKYFIF